MINSRRFMALSHIVAILLACAGCRSNRVELSSRLKMSDSASAIQLIAGFYNLEGDQWRWTARRFAVVLQQPAGSERNGARLRLQLFIPDAQIKKLGPMTLAADVEEVSLGSQTFAEAGSHSYSRNVPTALLGSGLLPVVFTFNKASAPSYAERRELASIVTEVSLERNQ